MNNAKIPKRITTALMNSLGSGVTPRIGLEYIAVGRRKEIETLLNDLANIAEGGSVFRFIAGNYGSGKSFLLQIIRNYAMDRNYVVTDADLSPERKLTGGKGQGLATYRELMQNLSTKVRPDGGALPSILEKWIANVQMQVMKEMNDTYDRLQLEMQVELRIMEIINSMDSMVHGFDFAKVLMAYWKGSKTGCDDLKNASLKWLRGEYATKSEAFSELGVRIIIDDDTWFDYIKLMSSFVRQLGYAGFLVLLDEGVNLYKISNAVSRNSNYEKVLNMFNDTMQGKVQGLGIYMGGTPQFIEDNRRGLFSYEALRTRLATTRFEINGLKDMQGPIIYLNRLTNEELFVLLKKVLDIHMQHYSYTSSVTEDDLVAFMQVVADRLETEKLLTPREVVRSFIAMLNVIKQNPEISFKELLTGDVIKMTPMGKNTDNTEDADSDAADFIL